VRPSSSLGAVRRVAFVAIAVAGVGLFGSGVRGLTQLDGQLADATGPTEIRSVGDRSEPRHDCPWGSNPERHGYSPAGILPAS
jgi:hypothetical protein